MTEKDLKKLNRYQLLELLIAPTDRADKLQEKLDEVEKKLADREIKIASLGSIAEASLQLSGVFEAAQEAADKYIDAAKRHAEQIIEAAYDRSGEILAQARSQARWLKGE